MRKKKVTRDNYRFYTSKNKIVAVSTFAGKPVRGVAKCSPDDAFSIVAGENLAMARCNEKVAEKRLRLAHRKFVEANEALIAAKRQYEKMANYLNNSADELKQAQEDVANIIASM